MNKYLEATKRVNQAMKSIEGANSAKEVLLALDPFGIIFVMEPIEGSEDYLVGLNPHIDPSEGEARVEIPVIVAMLGESHKNCAEFDSELYEKALANSDSFRYTKETMDLEKLVHAGILGRRQ